MAEEVEITFEREGLHGVVAVGSYLADVAKRFGIRPESPCDPEANEHHCVLEVRAGGASLSPPTEAELRYFETGMGAKRLGCQARIDGAEDIVIMTEEKAVPEETPAAERSHEDVETEYMKLFAELPLEKKMASLVKLEALALGDTLTYVANAPYTAADKVMGIMADLGFKRHAEEKEAVRPKEHSAANGSGPKTEEADKKDTDTVSE